MISKISCLQFFALSIIMVSLFSLSFIQPSYALLNAPTSSAGTTIDCNEESAGFTVTASLIDVVTLGAALDTLELLLDGSSFPTQIIKTLTADDITATSVVFTVSTGQLGSDGVKTITSKLDRSVLSDVLSNELTLTLDTSGCTLTSNVSTNLDSNVKTQIFDSLNPVISFAQINGFTNNEHTNLESIIQTQHLKVDEPFDFSIQFPADKSKYLQEVHLYLNLRETQREVYQSDTYVQYSKFKPLAVVDPHGYFSNVDVKEENVNGFLNYNFDIKFAKPMEQSNLIVQYIDEIHNFKRIEFTDALQVVEYDFHSPEALQLGGVSAVDEIVQQMDTALKTALKETLSADKQKQIEALSKWSENGKKIDDNLFQLINSHDPNAEAKRLGLIYKDGKAKVIVGISESKPELFQGLQTLGQVDFVSDEFVQMNLDLNSLSDLVEVNEVQKVRIPYVPTQHAFYVSEQVQSINADLVHFAGITGSGVKVAVIDLAFDLDNSKISPNIASAKSFRYGIEGSTLTVSGMGSEYLHGTAVAELVVDTAPNAELFLYTIGNDLEFTMALKDAVENKVDVITIPLGWANLSTDGSSYITNNVNAAVNEGTLVVVPAGNFAQNHWEGEYADENSNGWHEFTVSDEGLTFNITPDRIEKEIPLIVNLLWDDNTAGIDFDMVLVNPSNEIVSFSANVQNTQDDSTYEQIRYFPTEVGTYSVGIVYDGSHENPRVPIEIFSVNDELEHYVIYGSVVVPADADNIIVTGAVDISSGKIEPFSSQGPTNHGYAVPHVLAPDRASTIAYEDKLFYGTSAAAPYVAGVVALVLEIDPTISLEEIVKNIKENTIPQSSDFGIYCDNIGQCGLIDAELIIPWEKIR